MTYKTTSTEAFKIINDKFDLIFIDGLHLSEQVTEDIENSLKVLNTGGFIVLHDCNPPTEVHASRIRKTAEWNGDVYISFINFKSKNPNYKVHCVDTDWGVGIITKNEKVQSYGSFIMNEIDYLNWKDFNRYRKDLLNLISVDEFKKIYR